MAGFMTAFVGLLAGIAIAILGIQAGDVTPGLTRTLYYCLIAAILSLAFACEWLIVLCQKYLAQKKTLDETKNELSSANLNRKVISERFQEQQKDIRRLNDKLQRQFEEFISRSGKLSKEQKEFVRCLHMNQIVQPTEGGQYDG